MIRQKVTVCNITGLHLRPAGVLCETAARFESNVSFFFDGVPVNVKSVLSVLAACVKKGDEIELICDGEDEAEAMKALVEAIQSGLGEY